MKGIERQTSKKKSQTQSRREFAEIRTLGAPELVCANYFLHTKQDKRHLQNIKNL
jgi:hypothetical protein